MCPVLLVHKQYIQIIQVAATPLQREVVSGANRGEGGEVLEHEGWEDDRNKVVRHWMLSPPSTTG